MTAMIAVPREIYQTVEELCEAARKSHGDVLSDVILRVESPAVFVISGRYVRDDKFEFGRITTQLVGRSLDHLNDAAKIRYKEEMDADGRFKLKDNGVVRMHVYHDQRGPAVAMRLQPARIPRWEDLDFPVDLLKLVDQPQGIVIVSGPVGSGKSWLLHSLIDYKNRTGGATKVPTHIYMVGDPPEFDHEDIFATITQREIGVAALTYETALNGALRIRPRIFMVEEMRKRAEMEAVLKMALLGHLGFTTTHSNTTADTLRRFTQSFESDRQAEIVAALEDTLVAIVNIRLVPGLDSRLHPAVEILMNTPAMRSNLSKPAAVRDMLDQHAKDGMRSLEWDLARLVNKNVVAREVAEQFAIDMDRFTNCLKRAG